MERRWVIELCVKDDCADGSTLCAIKYIVCHQVHCVPSSKLCAIKYIVCHQVHCVPSSTCLPSSTLCAIKYIVCHQVHCVPSSTLCAIKYIVCHQGQNSDIARHSDIAREKWEWKRLEHEKSAQLSVRSKVRVCGNRTEVA